MVIAVLSDEVPANLRFLPGADEIMAGDCAVAAGQHALAVVLDCGSLTGWAAAPVRCRQAA